jgi:hypothetical protein
MAENEKQKAETTNKPQRPQSTQSTTRKGKKNTLSFFVNFVFLRALCGFCTPLSFLRSASRVLP